MFVSFLSRFSCDADNQILSNSETRIWNPILLVLILCTASFQICLLISPCVHQCFAHYHLIAPLKISNLANLWLVLSWKPCLFYRPFCYLQNVDFEGSHKNGFESLCSEYRHYWLSTLQYSAIIVTYWLPYQSLFQEMLSVLAW